jgi:hypothetical protein
VIAALAVVLAAAAAGYVLAPLLRASAGAGGPEAPSDARGDYARLVRERDAALRVLQDLALDHATGKMSDADYEALRQRQEAVALEVLRRLDAMASRRA